MGRLSRLAGVIARTFERAGVIDAERLRATVDLAWPRTVTGFAIMSKRAVDLALVGIAVGPTAVAGLAFAGAYWQVAKFLGIGLAGGTVGLVSQNYGGGEGARASLVVKQSVWIAAALSVPIVAGYAAFAAPLVDLLGSDPVAVRHGSTYLLFVAPGIAFEFLNLIASRTYAGAGDTFTPMAMRASGAVLNVVLGAALIFGLGLGVVGAALATTLSTGVVCLLLGWGLLGRSYGVPRLDASPVPLVVGGTQFDAGLTRQLLSVSAPLMARRVAEGLVVFPLLWIAASFGPVVVAALEIGRRVRALVNSFSWGFSIAASSLVGQRLGAGDEREAEAYGAAIVRLSATVYLAVAAGVIALAAPIAALFVEDPGAVDAAATFVHVGAISAIALGIDGSATGVLRGAGDTRWPFVASLVGRYGFALPVAALGTVTPLGVVGLYLALVVETLVPGAVNLRRFRTNRWKAVSRAYRPSAEPDTEPG